MARNSNSVQFTAIDVGDLSEIPPDLPAGAWQATSSVKKAATSKDKYPMLIVEWKTTEALTDGNDDYVGGKVADFLTFFPSSHKASRMTKLRIKSLCDALEIEIPTVTKFKSWDDISEFIDSLDGLQTTIYTTVEADKQTGEQRSKVRYTAPGALAGVKGKASAKDDADEEDDTPSEPVKKKLKKKVRPS